MKRLILLSVSVLLATTAFSQVSLSYKNNALIAGDSVISREIQYMSPGNAGSDQIWDFSKIQYTGKNLVCNINSTGTQELKDAGTYNVVSTEDGYTYFNNIDQNTYEIKGYTTDKVSLVYSNSVIKMKYPFSYSDQYTDAFAGNAVANEATQISFDGEVNVSADAYGTLVLPDRIINNTLRVRTEKNAIEIRPCSVIEVNIVQYSWYAQGFRYPVFSLTTRQYKYNSEDIATITHNAYVSLQQSSGSAVATGIQQQNTVDNSDYTAVSYPNPFSDKLTFNYFIRKQMPVTVGLYDMSGNLLANLVNDRMQTDGIHTGSFDAAAIGLTPGVYYIRFTFDKKTIVNKVVKI